VFRIELDFFLVIRKRSGAWFLYLVEGIDVLQQTFATFWGKLVKVSGLQNGISTVKVKVRFSTQLGTPFFVLNI